jgi:excisionase family DNA binding protein
MLFDCIGGKFMQLQTAKQTAEQLQITTYRLYEMVRLGLIPCVRMGRQIRFNPERIKEWIERGGSEQRANKEENNGGVKGFALLFKKGELSMNISTFYAPLSIFMR